MDGKKQDDLKNSLEDVLFDLNPLSIVLVGVSILDQFLLSLLKKYFIKGSTSERMLNTGTAGSLRARADIAYVLGLIRKKDHTNVVTILEIRNLFGHHYLLHSFESEKVVQLCKKLMTHHEKTETETDQEWYLYKFKYVLSDLIIEIQFKTDDIVKSKFQEVQPDSWELDNA